MPLFNTGNTTWDQGLNTLGSGLFPDPSKVAQAGYYGAEARNAMLKGAQTQDQMAHAHLAEQLLRGQTPQYNYQPAPGPNMPPIMRDPYAGGTGGPPPAAPPTAPPAAPPSAPPSLGTTVASGPAAPPAPASGGDGGQPPAPAAATPPAVPPAAAPAAAPPGGVPPPGTPVGQGMDPASLGALVAQGGGAVTPPQSGPAQPGPASAIQAANMTADAAENHPTLTKGSAPSVSSPAPGSGAPLAPNSTGSDGSVPKNDPVSGIFHPASVTPQGGGKKLSGPANADGSPAQPSIDPAQLVNALMQGGMNEQQANLQVRMYFSALFNKGIIDENTYHHFMGSADPTIINTDTTTQGNIKIAGINAGSAANVANIQGQTARDVENTREAGATGRTMAAPVFVPDPDKPGQGHWVTTGQLQGGTVTGGNPNTSATTVAETGKMGPYMKPGQPETVRTMSAGDAAAQGYVPYGTGALPAQTPTVANQQNFVDHNNDQQIYQQPQKGSVTSPGFVNAPVVFTPAMQQKIQAETLNFQRAGFDATRAHIMAIQKLQNSGDLPSVDQVNKLRSQGYVSTLGGRTSDARLTNSPTYDGKGTMVPHLVIGGKDEPNPNDPNAPTAFKLNPQGGPNQPPTSGAPVAAVPGGNTPMSAIVPGPARPVPAAPAPVASTPASRRGSYNFLENIFRPSDAGRSAPAQAPAPAPAPTANTTPAGTAIGRVPPGTPDGSIARAPNGQTGTVRGGVIYATGG